MKADFLFRDSIKAHYLKNRRTRMAHRLRNAANYAVEPLEFRLLLNGVQLNSTSLQSSLGTTPESSLIIDSNGDIFGTTLNGGVNRDGTIFEIAAGTTTVVTLVSFNGTDGRLPLASVTLDASQENLYGTTDVGGAYGDGTVYEFSLASHTLITLASFNGVDGSVPVSALTVDDQGDVFGITEYGGIGYTSGSSTGDGTVFEIVAGSGTITTIASFNGTNGQQPLSPLLVDGSGDFFWHGIEGRIGKRRRAVFEIAAGGTTIIGLASFNGGNGATPGGALAMDGQGNVFGTTQAGGAGNVGTVFEWTAAGGSISTLATFNGANGSTPQGGVLRDSSGNLFGTTRLGGASSSGTAFEVASGSDAVTMLATFNITNGSRPFSGLVQDGGGNFLGTTSAGAAGGGEVFQIAANTNSLSTLFAFPPTSGANPSGDLVADIYGNLYGTTENGGSGDGSIFEIAAGSGAVTTLVSFNVATGIEPWGSLLIDSSGNLYGSTQYGGPGENGNIFEVVNGSGTITDLADFTTSFPLIPAGDLVMDSSGDIFGSTESGQVFELAHGSSVITTIANSGNASGGIVMDSNGDIFGTTIYGNVFEIRKGTTQAVSIAEFNQNNSGYYGGTLTIDSSGNLYGTMPTGGANNDGFVFEGIGTPSSYMLDNGLNQTWQFSMLATFNGVNGANPLADLTLDANGNIFGTTQYGGTSNNGTIFDIAKGSNSLTTLYSFSGPDGSDPQGGLFFDSSGNIYGTTFTGGNSNDGTVFQIPAGNLPNKLEIAQQPTNAVTGSALSPVVVDIENGQGQLATTDDSTVTIVVASGPSGATIGGTYSTAAVNGVATFSNLVFNTGGVYTLAATVPGDLSGLSNTFQVRAASAASIQFADEPGNLRAGASIFVSVEVEDQNGNPVNSDPVTLSLASGPSATLYGMLTQLTSSYGYASYDLNLHQPGTYTFGASDGGISTTSISFTVSPSPASIFFVQQPTNVVAGQIIQPAITVEELDYFGNPLVGDSVTLQTYPESALKGTLVETTNANGIATFGDISIDKSGTFILAAVDNKQAGSNTFTVSAAPAAIVNFSQEPANVIAGQSITPALAIQVEDQFGDPIQGNSVTLSIASGPSATLLGYLTQTTNSSGIATFTGITLDTAGTYTLSATDGSISNTSTSFTVSPAAVASLPFIQQPTNVVAGQGISPAITVEAEDQFDNLISGTNITLSVASGPSNALLGTRTQATNSGGVATFSGISLDTAGTYMLVADDLAAFHASTSFTVRPAAATLMFIQQPTNVVAGQSITPSITVEAEDQFANPIAGDSITLSVASGPGNSLLGTLTQPTNSVGIATFSGISLDTAGTYTLAATDGSTSGNSTSFNVKPAAVASVTFTTAPSNVMAGADMNPVVVHVQDAYGNAITGDTVTLSASSPGGIASGGSAVSDPGDATFSKLVLDTAGTYTLVANDGSASSSPTNSFTVSPAAVASVSFTQQPTNVGPGQSITPAITVEADDQFGNQIDGDSVTLSVASGPSNSLVGTLTQSTNASGIATFNDISLNTDGTYTLTATDGSVSGASTSFAVGTIASLVFIQQPTNILAGENISPAITVQAEDQFGNPVNISGAAIALSVASGRSDVLLGTLTEFTNSSGIATFGDISMDSVGSFTLIAKDGGVSSLPSNNFSTFAHLAFKTQPGNTVAGTKIAQSIIVDIVDGGGYVEITDDSSVTIALGGQWGTGKPITVAAKNGIATFKSIIPTNAGIDTLSATDGSDGSVVSNPFTVNPSPAVAKIVYAVQPANVAAGSAINPGVVVDLEDKYGNLETGDNTDAVTLSVATGPAGNTGIASGATATASGGVATFSGVALDIAGKYTLNAAVGSLKPVKSAGFTVAAGPVAHLSFSTEPPTTAVHKAKFTVKVTATDAFGNLITGDAIVMSLASNPAGGILSGTLKETTKAGIASFSTLSLNLAGSYILEATDGGVSIDSSSITVT